MWNVSLSIYCCLSKPNIYHYLSLWRAKIIGVVLFPALVKSRVGTHQLCIAVWEWSMPTVSSRGSWLWALREAFREDAPLPPGVLRGGRFGSRSPRGSLLPDLSVGVGTGSALSQLSHARSSVLRFPVQRNWYH